MGISASQIKAYMTTTNNKILSPKLSAIVHLLGKVLGLVIKEQEGVALFNKVEEIRTLSKASRGRKSNQAIGKAFKKLKSHMLKLKPKESLIIARSFSQFLNFSNLAESLYSVHQIHSHRVRKAQGTNEFIILEDAITRLLKQKFISKKKFYQIAKDLHIDLVLTAHPTQVKRRTLIQKYAYVNDILEKFNKLRIFTKKNIEREEKLLEKNLYEQATSIWKTDEIMRAKPTPLEEAKWGLAVIDDSLWSAIPKLCSRFDSAVLKFTGKSLPINYSPITFGSWMGGDRDGNPSVTAKVTEEVVLLSRWKAANLYEAEFTKMIQALSMHECSKVIRKKVGKTRDPYRVFLRPIRNKMKSTQEQIELFLNYRKPIDQSLIVQSIGEVLLPLNEVYKSLYSVKCEVIADGLVLDLLRQTHAFGLSLAKLDIRQESSRHEELLNNVCIKIGLGDYKNWSEEEKIYFLSKRFSSKDSLIPRNMTWNKEDKEVWSTFKMIAKLPYECMGTYIVSMSHNVSDILAVLS